MEQYLGDTNHQDKYPESIWITYEIENGQSQAKTNDKGLIVHKWPCAGTDQVKLVALA